MNDDDQESSDSTGDPDLDRQVADLESKGSKVGEGIDQTRSDWEAKKDDPAVPGAARDPDEDEDDGPPQG